MQLKLEISGSRAIVYDANRISQPDAKLFEPDYWLQAGAVVDRAMGRGNALMLETPYGPAVLRQYLRGGIAAKISRERYVYLGYTRSRPVVEATLLSRMSGLGLPVPEVLGAICWRHGLAYSGALLTKRIPEAEPLADLMPGLVNTDSIWTAVGHCLQRFHAAGVYHADLNARNILVDKSQTIWLIDFDRGRILRPGDPRLQRNLQRLHRSLVKQATMPEAELEACWQQLMLAYKSVSQKSSE